MSSSLTVQLVMKLNDWPAITSCAGVVAHAGRSPGPPAPPGSVGSAGDSVAPLGGPDGCRSPPPIGAPTPPQPTKRKERATAEIVAPRKRCAVSVLMPSGYEVSRHLS